MVSADFRIPRHVAAALLVLAAACGGGKGAGCRVEVPGAVASGGGEGRARRRRRVLPARAAAARSRARPEAAVAAAQAVRARGLGRHRAQRQAREREVAAVAAVPPWTPARPTWRSPGPGFSASVNAGNCIDISTWYTFGADGSLIEHDVDENACSGVRLLSKLTGVYTLRGRVLEMTLNGQGMG